MPDKQQLQHRIKQILARCITADAEQATARTDNNTVAVNRATPYMVPVRVAIERIFRVKDITKTQNQLRYESGELDRATADVSHAIEQIKTTKPSRIRVSVVNNMIVLTGTVSERAVKNQLVKDAVGLVGDSNMKDRLVLVSTSSLIDRLIAVNIINTLETNRLIEPGKFDVTVNRRVVILRGETDSFTEQLSIFTIIRNLWGVKCVKNEMKITSRSPGNALPVSKIIPSTKTAHANQHPELLPTMFG